MTNTQDYSLEYWEYTVGTSDFKGDKWFYALETTINHIDSEENVSLPDNKNIISTPSYKKLQEKISNHPLININSTSIRKYPSTFVKNGFIEPGCMSYHPRVKDFLETKNYEDEELRNKVRSNIFEEIFYENSKFRASAKKKFDKTNYGLFLINTIANLESGLESEAIPAIMLITDISSYKKGYLSRDEIEKAKRNPDIDRLVRDKYNQIRFLRGVLKKLSNIEYISSRDTYVLRENLSEKELEELEIISEGRDGYKQRQLRSKLENESAEVFSEISCMLTRKTFSVRRSHLASRASHIKPFRDCDPEEQYDPNNALLLNLFFDDLFDINFGDKKCYASFASDGKVLLSDDLLPETKKIWSGFKLDRKFLNQERLYYLDYHRSHLA